MALPAFFILLLSLHSGFGSVLLDIDDELSVEGLTWPSEYHLQGEELDLLSGLKETFEIWYSADLNRSRIDYYGGTHKTYFYGSSEENNSTGTEYIIHPYTTEYVTNELICSGRTHNDEAEDFLPKIKNLTYLGDKTYRGKHVQEWARERVFQEEFKSQMTIYVEEHDGVHIPVQIIKKKYDLERGNLEMHIVINYYGFNDSVCLEDLDAMNENADCEEMSTLKNDYKNNLKFLYHGISKDLDLAFDSYKDYHNKIYDDEEHDMRKEIFHQNWRYIVNHNRKNLSYKLEINEFVDRTDSELQHLTGTRPSNPEKSGAVPFPHSLEEINRLVEELPEEYDMRLEGAITPVKNQDDCGSCWAFCTTAAVEGAWAKRNGGRDLDLSEQSLVDCAWGFDNAGCNGGQVDGGMKYVLAHGLPTESEYGPYLAKEGYCSIQNMTKVYSIVGFGQVTPRNVNALKVALVKYGPVVVGVHAGKNMKYYSSGVFYDVDCDGETLNHGVTVVGYGVKDGDTYWIVKNSWGENWGEEGYILMSATNNNCLLMDVAYYPIV